MSTKANPATDPFVVFDQVTFEREASASAGASNVDTDAKWQALIDPAVDAVVNNWTATAGQKTIFKAFLKALFHSVKINPPG